MKETTFNQLAQQFQQAAHQTLIDAAKLGVETAQNTDKFNIGKLKDAIKFHPTDATSGFILADKPYAFWLEEGNDQNGPFISATSAKCLHFFSHGQEVFAKKVRSHGPYNFMQHSKEVVEQAIPEIFADNLKRA